MCVESGPKMPWMKNIVFLCISCVSVCVNCSPILKDYLDMIIFPIASPNVATLRQVATNRVSCSCILVIAIAAIAGYFMGIILACFFTFGYP